MESKGGTPRKQIKKPAPYAIKSQFDPEGEDIGGFNDFDPETKRKLIPLVLLAVVIFFLLKK